MFRIHRVNRVGVKDVQIYFIGLKKDLFGMFLDIEGDT